MTYRLHGMPNLSRIVAMIILFGMFMILDVFRVVSFVQAVAMTQNSSVIGEKAILFVAE